MLVLKVRCELVVNNALVVNRSEIFFWCFTICVMRDLKQGSVRSVDYDIQEKSLIGVNVCVEGKEGYETEWLVALYFLNRSTIIVRLSGLVL